MLLLGLHWVFSILLGESKATMIFTNITSSQNTPVLSRNYPTRLRVKRRLSENWIEGGGAGAENKKTSAGRGPRKFTFKSKGSEMLIFLLEIAPTSLEE